MDSGFFVIEMLLIFVLPGIAAAVAVGGVGRKIAWYAGAASLVFLVDIVVSAAFMTPGMNQGNESLVSAITMLVAGIVIIAIAGSGGRKCHACRSRIHAKATRCPKCQTDLGRALGGAPGLSH
jgi:hypothetical protein